MKDFIIIGNMNAIALKDFFPLIKENKVFLRPKQIKYFISKEGILTQFGNTYWYTTFKIDGDMKPLVLTQKYSPEKYPRYDNYDAIEVSKTAEIPCDYYGVMAVPITFIDKFNPDQFDILGATESEGKGFSNGLWDESSGVAQPLLNGKKLYKRIFIRRKTK